MAQGYAYTDKYGFSHVVGDQATAQQYAQPGSIKSYTGNFAGGYATDNSGNRMAVPTPGAVAYGNDRRDGVTTQWAPSNSISDVPAPMNTQNVQPNLQAPQLSSVPPIQTNQNAFSGSFGQIQSPQAQTKVLAVSPPSFSNSALNNNNVVGGSAQYSPSAVVGVRDAFEKQGYKVDWNPSTKSVVLTDPNGLSTVLNEGDYTNQDGTARISNDQYNKILSQHGGVVPPPPGLNQPLTYDQIQKQVQDKINAQIKYRQDQANAQIQSYQNAFNNNMQTLRDNRTLENLQFDRNNNPYSGGADYRRAMLDRQREISDAQAQQQLNSQIGQINMGVNDYANQLQTTSDSQIRDIVNQERNYQLEKDKFDWEKQYQTGQLGVQQAKARYDMLQSQLQLANKKLDTLGYATQDVADLLGVPVGTPSFEAKKAAAQMQLDLQKFQETQNYHNQEIGVRQQETSLRQQANEIDKNYKQSLIDRGISAEHAKTATNAAVAAILNSGSYEQGLNAIYQKKDELTSDGVNVSDVLKALDSKFPKDSYGERQGNQ